MEWAVVLVIAGLAADALGYRLGQRALVAAVVRTPALLAVQLFGSVADIESNGLEAVLLVALMPVAVGAGLLGRRAGGTCGRTVTPAGR